MFDYLVDHALKNVWCAPRQDMQSRVAPARLTPPNGAFNEFNILWRTHKLPIQGKRFHVFQIGQLNPRLMGLFPSFGKWTTIAEACSVGSMIADLYVKSGVELPRTQSWYMVTRDKNLVLCVLEQPKIVADLGTEPLYMRVYTNAYFYSLRAQDRANGVKVGGGTVGSTAEILALQTTYEDLQNKPGHVYAFVNGYKVSGISLLTAKVGDVVEYVYDSSIERIVEWGLNTLPTFASSMDQKQKYLLHYQGPDQQRIDYQDDIDFFLIKPGQLPSDVDRTGIYIGRNALDTVRMVTHRDYSIVVPYLVAYADSNGWTDPSKLRLRAHIRKAGFDRKLVKDHNRIFELYKLPDDEIQSAMLGVHSTVSNWRADVLEASAYTWIMGAEPSEVTKPKVEQAYGYNAISKILADTPKFTRLEGTTPVVDVPYGLQNYSTGFEYDAQGKLINWYTHVSGERYPTRNQRTKLVEMFSALVDDKLDEYHEVTTQPIDPRASYRMYTCPKIAGVPTYQWTDVTDSALYGIVNNQLTWFVDPAKVYTVVRSDAVMLAYSFELEPQDSLLKFSLTYRVRIANNIQRRVMSIPMGELDLYLNDRPIIEGIDYKVNFPEIVIFNKEYRNQLPKTKQKITVRFSGFCDSQFKRIIPTNVGFVNYGLLSRNNRYDIMDDKVLMIAVDGALYDRSQLKFSESDTGVYPQDARNGSPYMIRDIVVPMRGQTTRSTYPMRQDSIVVDQRVSAYLTERMPKPILNGPSVSQDLYAVYSPFFAKIMYDLINGWLWDERLHGHYGDNVVKELCTPYESLLQYDPTQEANRLDPQFVIVHPHDRSTVVTIDIYFYKFLSRVAAIYLRNRVDLANHLKIRD